MKKILATAITLFSLATTVTFAQGVYPRSFDNRPNQAQSPQFNNTNQYQGDLRVDQLDAIVGLSRRQERQVNQINANYDRILATSRLNPDGYHQLQLRKRQDILAVLTSGQRDLLFAAQSQPNINNRFNRNQPNPYGRRG